MNTEEWIARLERESSALDVAFARNATQVPVYTKSVIFQTSRNVTHIVLLPDGAGDEDLDSPERIVVTLNTTSGANTNAKLELTCSSEEFPIVRRRVFDGGAQWIVTNLPDYDSDGNWRPTQYELFVQSFLDGEVIVENMES